MAGLLDVAASWSVGALEDDETKRIEQEQARLKERAESAVWHRLYAGMEKTRQSLIYNLGNVFSGGDIDDDFYDELEETLIMADIGVVTTEKIIDEIRSKVFEQRIHDRAQTRQILVDTMKEMMRFSGRLYRFENEDAVVLFVGVNGVGKTTTVGKLGAQLKNSGRKVMFAAADTFRAAAANQLIEWAKRADCDIVTGNEGSDPGAVVFDAASAMKARGHEVLLCDTAGRLQNKKNLMNELKKISGILDRELPGRYRETLLVLDGTTGQNAISQAKEFSAICDVTGIVITKLDGTAKGGIAVAIASELGIPVKYIGVGEGLDDLEKFESDDFVDALFGV